MIKVDEDKATRLIAQRLRDEANMSSTEANALATKIVAGLAGATPFPTKPLLRNWKMIPFWPTADMLSGMLRAAPFPMDQPTAENLWQLVYKQGRDLPDDVVMTDL